MYGIKLKIKEINSVEQFEKTSAMNFSEASLLAYYVMETVQSSCNCEDTVYAQLMFVQNGGTNEYRPNWVFETKEHVII